MTNVLLGFLMALFAMALPTLIHGTDPSGIPLTQYLITGTAVAVLTTVFLSFLD